MTWEELLKQEKEKEYFKQLISFVETEYQENTVFPPKEEIFNALTYTPYDKVKVVLIGQDPYSTKGFANGLAFSVNPDIKLPKSLQNIFKELVDDLDISYPSNGDLTIWAKNGVLLLNTILTVREGKPLSHQKKGWEKFTLRIIEQLNEREEPIAFLLLGNKAKELAKYITNSNHYIIETSHPSPLGAYQGFLGSKVFSKCCKCLNLSKDFWRLP